MTSTIARTSIEDPVEAGSALGRDVLAGLGGEPPDAVLLFTASRFDYSSFLHAFQDVAHARTLIGGSTVGAYTAKNDVTQGACAIGIRSLDVSFSASLARGLRADRTAAARRLLLDFRGLKRRTDAFRSAIVLMDARSGNAEEFVHELILGSHGTYQFLGGGATDDMLVDSSHVFFGTDVYEDSAVALEILSKHPLGVGVVRSWRPAGTAMRVTAAEGNRLISLNAAPAVECVEEHARRTGQAFDRADPIQFFLRNLFGVDLGNGIRLRVPLVVQDDGAIMCAAEIPEGSLVRIMTTSAEVASEAVQRAAASARMQLAGRDPEVGIFFDCITARLRKDLGFGYDLRWVEGVLGTEMYAGVGTAGQIVRAEGEFGGFQNSTGVLLLLPR